MQPDQEKRRSLTRAFGFLVEKASIAGALLAFFLMFLITADVIGREAFRHPIPGVPEIVKFSVVAILFLQSTQVLKEGRHIRSTLVLDRLPRLGRDILELAAYLLGMIVFGLLFYAELTPASRAWKMGDYEGEILKIRTFPVHAIILFGSALMVLQYIVLLFRKLRQIFRAPRMRDGAEGSWK